MARRVQKSQYFPSLVGNTGTPWNPSGFGKVIVLLLVIGLAITSSWIIPGNPLWHSVSPGPTGLGHDPTTAIQKYQAPNSNLAEFNTAGTVTYTTSCGGLGTTPCMKLTSKSPPPSLSGKFTLPFGTLKITQATITPQTATTVYRRVTGFSNNATFFFDVSGGNSQTGSYLITTSATTTVTFAGPQPIVTCTCSATYSSGEEVLTFSPGLSSSLFTLNWTTGQNLQFLGGLAESVNPVGDLSIAVSKEIEAELAWTPSNNATITNNCANLNCSWGFFLTTNSSLWQTNKPNFNPYNDTSVALFMEIHKNSGSSSFTETLYIQQKAGETLVSENSGTACGFKDNSGSGYLCTGPVTLNILGTFGVSWLNLNYTGSSNAAQVGGTVSCPNGTGTGGPGCSYISLTENCLSSLSCGGGGQIFLSASDRSPQFQLASTTYYIGYWVGASQLGTSFLYCFDVGVNCGAAGTLITQGCTSASMEIDYCVPNPVATNNNPQGTTDSGGFFGSIGRFLGGVGSTVLSLGSSGVNYITSVFTGGVIGFGNWLANNLQLFGSSIFGVFKGLLNTLGSIIGLPNLGNNLFTLLGDLGTWFIALFADTLANLGQAVTALVNGFAVFGGTLGTYWTNISGSALVLADIFAGFWIIVGQVFAFSFGLTLSAWLLYGAVEYLSSTERGMAWYSLTGYVLLLGFSVTWWLFIQSLNIVITIAGVVTGLSTTEEASKSAVDPLVAAAGAA